MLMLPEHAASPPYMLTASNMPIVAWVRSSTVARCLVTCRVHTRDDALTLTGTVPASITCLRGPVAAALHLPHETLTRHPPPSSFKTFLSLRLISFSLGHPSWISYPLIIIFKHSDRQNSAGYWEGQAGGRAGKNRRRPDGQPLLVPRLSMFGLSLPLSPIPTSSHPSSHS